MPGSTPIYGLPFPELDEAANGPDGIEQLALAVESTIAGIAVPIVTSMPASPNDDDEVILVDSLTAPSFAWHFVYSTGITGTRKWLPIGRGRPLRGLPVDASGSGATTSTAYIDGSNTPTLTVPEDGLYDIAHGALMGGANYGRQSVKIGGAASADADATIIISAGSAGAALASWQHKLLRDRSLTAGTVLKLQLKTNDSGVSVVSQERYLELTPVLLLG